MPPTLPCQHAIDAVGRRRNAPETCLQSSGQEEQAATTKNVPHLSYVHAYFRHVHRAYPFLDREQTIERAKASTNLELWRDGIINLVMAIGSTTLERAGKLSPHVQTQSLAVPVPYTSILTRSLSFPSIEGLHVLTLLSLYSLFDTQGVSTWTIVGILTRQAISLGLSRPGSASKELALYNQELRHRLFWSIFVLDRMVAVSVGHPAGLIDDNMAVPQPAVTVLEFASPDRAEHVSLLQLNRHIIHLRQLEYRILSSVHLKNHAELSKLSPPDRNVLSSELRSAIDEWYGHACLVSLPEADNIPIHSTITWLNARYYNLLVLLYYPCHFNSQSRHASTKDLLAYVSKFINYNQILLEQRQLPLNYITLGRLIPACLVLVHCFAVTEPQTYTAKSETNSSIDILRAFPAVWSSAHRTAGVMSEFIELVASHEAYASHQLVHFDYASHAPLRSSTKTWLHDLRIDLLDIMRKTLSNSSCYLDVEAWDNANRRMNESFGSLSPTTGTSPNVPSPWVTDCGFELGYL
ncbi:hypothetical protein P280DRAFT_499803 [Massarina eburnea CBS 473.64]|uniref:Xylanolytic transcriptional activator regulatory domain-containing protein n=1 Tax=Massarina eburnea CBS 473.64 TaxID=1395130 RepID=A0A6A6RU11_9PLEO|nr:hypothetical protein P280DRAFT_499803 [Massarina eburnea CBS 473.64]